MKPALRLTIMVGLAFHFSVVGVHAQFDYETNNGTITITKYTGPGGNVIIPETINGLSVRGSSGVVLSCRSFTLLRSGVAPA